MYNKNVLSIADAGENQKLPADKTGIDPRAVKRDLCQEDYEGKVPKQKIEEFIKKHEDFKKKFLDALEKFNIDTPHLVELGWVEPFLGSMSRRIAKHPVAWISTAGVTPNRGEMQLLFNPIFMHKMSQGDPEPGQVPDYNMLQQGKLFVQGILKHELYHVIMEHVTTRRALPHTLWNIATDAAINSLIPRNELPAWTIQPGIIPLKPRDAPPDWKPSLIASKLEFLPRGKNSEWYMNKFLEDEDIKNAIERAQQAAMQNCPPDSNADDTNASKQRQHSFEKELSKELFGDSGSQFDDHNIWDEMSDAERDKMRDTMRDILRDVIKEAEQSPKGWGSIPSDMQRKLRRLVSREVDWRDLLSQFVGRSRATTTTSSFKRISRRCPWEYPGKKRSYTCHAAVAIDQSGSMKTEWIELLFAELNNLGNLSGYSIIPFDYTVAEDKIQHIRKGQKPDFERVRAGGTNFNAPIEYINEHADKYDLLLIGTDGECVKPIPCSKPVAYILSPGCALMFQPDPGQIVIKMKGNIK